MSIGASDMNERVYSYDLTLPSGETGCGDWQKFSSGAGPRGCDSGAEGDSDSIRPGIKIRGISHGLLPAWTKTNDDDEGAASSSPEVLRRVPQTIS